MQIEIFKPGSCIINKSQVDEHGGERYLQGISHVSENAATDGKYGKEYGKNILVEDDEIKKSEGSSNYHCPL